LSIDGHHLPPLLKILRESRDEIYQLFLLDPARPDFEGTDKTAKYTNFVSLLFVNKQVNVEVKAAFEHINPLMMLSCNVKDLHEPLTEHAIPFFSEGHAG
jgi:hypothetical protein